MKKSLVLVPLLSYLLILVLSQLSDFITQDLKQFESELKWSELDVVIEEDSGKYKKWLWR